MDVGDSMFRFFRIGIGCLLLSITQTGFNAHAGDIDTWIAHQTRVSQVRMYRNISPAGTVRGTILASPSKHDPNYYYYWVRDGALVMQSILGLYEKATGAERDAYFRDMDDYVRMSRANQLEARGNLGEPRFNVDGTLNTEPWGRPQNDGPALRALVLIRFANGLLDQGRRDYVEKHLYAARLPAETVVKADLEYTGHSWRNKCIDLWEEIWAHHFFTRAVQLAALREGAKLATRLKDAGAAAFYSKQADLIEGEITKHWSDSHGYYKSAVESDAGPDHQKPSELDASVVLAALASEQATGPLSIADGKILATADKIEKSFASLYNINKNKSVGTAVGRYPEDYYFGGNPWVLTTAAFAELNYRLAVKIDQSRSFKVNANQAGFFAKVLPQGERGLLRAGTDLAASPLLKAKVIEGLFAKGDQYMERIRLHVNPDGSLSEQINRENGFMLSAPDLTWSYASFIRASAARGTAQPAED